MKRVYIYALMAASVLFATSCQNIEQEGVGTGADSEEIAPYVQGELMVKFTPEVADIIENTGLTRSGATRSGIVTVDEVHKCEHLLSLYLDTWMLSSLGFCIFF